jgi:hypothetical protein
MEQPVPHISTYLKEKVIKEGFSHGGQEEFANSNSICDGARRPREDYPA